MFPPTSRFYNSDKMGLLMIVTVKRKHLLTLMFSRSVNMVSQEGLYSYLENAKTSC